jgi:hypothetical protein
MPCAISAMGLGRKASGCHDGSVESHSGLRLSKLWDTHSTRRGQLIAGNFAAVLKLKSLDYRLRRAEAVLSVATDCCTDVAKLKAGALHTMLMDYRSAVLAEIKGARRREWQQLPRSSVLSAARPRSCTLDQLTVI